MGTEERIKKIEELAAVFEPLLEPNGLKFLHLMPEGPVFNGVPPQQFVEICEHFSSVPSVSSHPTTWVKVGVIEIFIKSAEVNIPKLDRNSALQGLKQLVNPV